MKRRIFARMDGPRRVEIWYILGKELYCIEETRSGCAIGGRNIRNEYTGLFHVSGLYELEGVFDAVLLGTIDTNISE